MIDNEKCTLECAKATVSAMKRFVLGRSVRSRTYIADRKKGTVLFDTVQSGSKEYALVQIVATFVAFLIGIACIAVRLKNGAKYKKTVRLQAKEIKRLRKLCRCAEKENVK